MTIAAHDVLAVLIAMPPRPTAEAPDDCRGIYGLVDHEGKLRYIGSTSAADETFRKRIHHRHRTGSESHSHYFSRLYNTGRMYRLRNDAATKADGDVAKRLRNAFVSEYCAAVWVPLPDEADIAGLEAQVIALAPPAAKAWNFRRTDSYAEPEALVDALIERLGLSPFERAALSRQKARFEGGAVAAETVLPPLPEGPFRFFALDVETANHDRASICQVGVACVRPDDSIVTWVTLVDPQTRHWSFTGLHGIHGGMVRDAPRISEVLEALEPLLSGSMVYQHSGFDRSAVRAACAGLGRSEPDWQWLDSVGIARRAWPELKGNGGHGLASLKQFLGLSFEHHDAGEDACAAAQVVLHAERGTVGRHKVPRALVEEVETTALPPAEHLPTGSVLGRAILTAGNLKNSHFYLRAFLDKFPPELVDASKAPGMGGHVATVIWGDGISSRTDICPRHKFFRDRANTRAFFARTGAKAGDEVEVVRSSPGVYSVRLIRA